MANNENEALTNAKPNDNIAQAEQKLEQKQLQKQENKKASSKIVLFLIIVLLVGGGYFAYWFFYASFFEDTEDAYVSADQNAVTSQLYATVSSLNIQDGQQVKQGDLAIDLDATDYQLALNRAESALAIAVRNYNSLQFGADESENTVNLRQSDLTKVTNDFKRDDDSYKAGLLSKQAWLDSKYRLEQSTLAVIGAKSLYANSKVKAVSKNVYEHPDVIKAINDYKQAYHDLYRTKIRIPVAGKIAKRAVFVGQRVAPNQTLFSVINLSAEWVDVNLKESQLKNLKVGQIAKLTSDVNNKSYVGYVTSIGAGSGSSLSLLPAQNATGNWIKIVQRVPIRVDFDKESIAQNGVLPIGTSVRVSIDTRTSSQVKAPIAQKTSVYAIDDKILDEKIKAIVAANMILNK